MPELPDLARRLGRQAEAVCRSYLSSGRREGGYWLVGDVRNTKGRSMFVRLKDTPQGPAGKWVDAATGEHGDLLDVIRASCGFAGLEAAVQEAKRFLSLPRVRSDTGPLSRNAPAPLNSTLVARRLVRRSQPIRGTLAQAYLRNRGIADLHDAGSLRFHPCCVYRSGDTPIGTWPAMIAAVTDLTGQITGAHRTYLDPQRGGKAPVDTPRRAIGALLGNAVRFGQAEDVMAAGEGIETVLSLTQVLVGLPIVAALSATHLAACRFPEALRRLYIVQDNDPAGKRAVKTLIERANAAGIEAIVLSPSLNDFNDDLRIDGHDALRMRVRSQVKQQDLMRFLR